MRNSDWAVGLRVRTVAGAAPSCGLRSTRPRVAVRVDWVSAGRFRLEAGIAAAGIEPAYVPHALAARRHRCEFGANVLVGLAK